MKTTQQNKTAATETIEKAAQEISTLVAGIKPARSKNPENYRDIAAQSTYLSLALDTAEKIKGDYLDDMGRFYEEVRLAKEVLSKVSRLSIPGVARQGGFAPADNEKIISATARAVQFIKSLSATQSDLAI